MQNIGIIGAGVMGRGVAQSFAQARYNVVLIDIKQEILDQAKEEIYRNIRFKSFLDKSKEIESAEAVLERITFATDYQLLEKAEFIIENVPEKWSVKEEVYKSIDKICRRDCVFSVNTSCISITRVASLTQRPSQFIGTHFMNPVPLKSSVEVIKGYHTSDKTLETTKQLLSTIGKECIIVNDFPGFVSNRISHIFMNEAAFVVQDQVASPQEVDDIFKKCYEHKMGPLETIDLIGLDTVVNSLDVLYESYQDPKFRCCPLLRKMVDAGLLGIKTGEGFYKYY